MSPSPPDRIAGIEVEQLERIIGLLRDKLPGVFQANRFFEERTGLHNEAGSNNLNDALSHLATLAEHATDLSSTEQAEQVAHLEDHLRRSMMEAFEQTLRLRLADVAEAWDAYEEELTFFGRKYDGGPSHQSLVKKRDQVLELLEIGRESKRSPSWDDWEEGTGALAQACDLANDLLDELKQARREIEAEWFRRVRPRLQIALALLAVVIGIGIGLLLGGLVF